MRLQKLKRSKQRARRLKPFTVLRCPMNGHQVSWCRGLCQPVNGIGACGRLAAHAMLDRTQRAILRFKEEQVTTAPTPRLARSEHESRA